MLTRLSLLDDEIAVHEARVAAARERVRRRRFTAGEAVNRRLARPDSLLAAGGAGVLYGLWVTRPCDGRASGGGTAVASSWLGRTMLSAALSWLLSGLDAPAGAEPGVPDA